MNKTEQTESADAKAMADRPTASADATTPAEAKPKTIPVSTRFDRAELDEMKDDTGANADATAVACFVRKNLRKRD